MAKNTKQITQSFGLAALVVLLIHCFSCFIGLVIFAHNSSIDHNSIMMYAIDHYSFVGLRGFAVVGVMAMIMSTADSWLNTSAVIFSHDFCKPLGLVTKNELLLSRIFTVFIGTVAILLALSAADLLQLLLFSGSFYRPIVTIPLILAILGFRSSPKALGIGMLGGAMCVVIWKNFITPITGINSVFPAMVTNLVFFMGSHYLLHQKGGWVGIKDKSDLDMLRQTRSHSISSIIDFFKTLPQFDIKNHCNKLLPKTDAVYSYFAFSALLSILASFTMDKNIYIHNTFIVNSLQIVALLISTAFFCRNILFINLFTSRYMGLIWYGSIFISLAFISSFLVIMGEFSQISLIAFILSLSIIGLLLTWQAALGMMITGAIVAFYAYEILIGSPTVDAVYDLKLQISYIVLMVGGFTIAFLKPKQDSAELTEEKLDDMADKINDYKQELHKALELKYEFLRNLQHEARTPITGITSMAQVIDEAYDKLPEDRRRKAIHDIAVSGERLESYVNNLIDVSKLLSLKYDLQLQSVNLGKLVTDRLMRVSKLYIPQNLKDTREFVLDIAPNIILNCDEYYIGRSIENILINAIQYCTEGKIEIKLAQTDDGIEFSVRDAGVGIPLENLKDIFGAFTTSTKTKTSAGGRGVGLALAKVVIDLHKGKITADSDGESWTRIAFVL